MVSDNKIFSDDLEIAAKFNEFFKNAVNNLNLSSNEGLLRSTTHLSDPVQIAIEKYKNHPSKLTIQNNVSVDQSLSFQMASTDTTHKQINLLNSKKNGTDGGIPPKCLKLAVNESAPNTTNNWNEKVVSSFMFPESLKLANVTPVYKKGGSALVSNYRPISVLTTFFCFNWDTLHARLNNGITRKRSTKRLQHTGNLFRKNLQLKDAC